MHWIIERKIVKRKMKISVVRFLFFSAALSSGFLSHLNAQSAADPLIQISVEVVEVNNRKAREAGIKWTDEIKTGEVSWRVAARAPEFLPEIPSIMQGGDWARYTPFTANFRMLLEKGAARIMSKPRLVTRSGTEARVLVGGKYPIVAAGVGGGSVEWKEYGIRLQIQPRSLPDKRISAVLTAEVSRLDWANKVGVYPAVATRTATSEIIVKSGDTITIAGLTENVKEEKVVGVPLLMDIPLLGTLFRVNTFVEAENTVVIFVTPSLLE